MENRGVGVTWVGAMLIVAAIVAVILVIRNLDRGTQPDKSQD
ncbi:MAG TPA: hypothetical protein VFB23_09895 [Candidatus Acidoferrales bacterium]|nr:hypothetical protein [Candidatus Acidoferrales bacterium]